MQTLLIVEDEKMIRQGIRTMVQRSGVNVDLILECSNGIDALNLLSERHVDVMFTDIRMQKMDGIELVRRVNEMEDKPLIVAISGYDDFTYAVEMLRNGVREYILKPVEREKIAEILKKLDAELEAANREHSKNIVLGMRQMRELIEKGSASESERELIIGKYEPYFYEGDYAVCIFDGESGFDAGDAFVIEDTSDGTVVVLKSEHINAFLKGEVYDKCVGLSGLHKGLSKLPEAYAEASLMRKLSFVRSHTCKFGEDTPKSINENISESAMQQLSASERTKRIQLLGTNKTEEVLNKWKSFFALAERESVGLPEFSAELDATITQILEVYRENITAEDTETAEKCRILHNFNDISDYRNCFTDWILDLNKRLADRPDDINIRRKIAQAREYIDENYASDLNMAVVSNYVSMNYSLFSYSFKQYTGMNFVNYLKEIRINKARELLSDTDLKIIEISQTVGYENEKNFMKIFKSLCGVTPGEYRKNTARSE